MSAPPPGAAPMCALRSLCRDFPEDNDVALSILLADDHLMVREGLKALLEAQGLQVVGEASTDQEALEKSCALHPDIAVLDLSMPTLGGLEASRAIRSACPSVRTIALTVHREEQYVLAALGVGFTGYVLKSQAASDLVQAIGE